MDKAFNPIKCREKETSNILAFMNKLLPLFLLLSISAQAQELLG